MTVSISSCGGALSGVEDRRDGASSDTGAEEDAALDASGGDESIADVVADGQDGQAADAPLDAAVDVETQTDSETAASDSGIDATTDVAIEAGCSGMVCSGACVDVTTDGHNCGRCGHDCWYGGCVAGVCQPVVIGQNLDHPTDIKVDPTNVYVTNYGGNAVVEAPLAGGPFVPLAAYESGPEHIALDGTSAYWTDALGGTVMTVPLAGGTPTTIASAQSRPWAIAVDAQNVYWTTLGATFGTGALVSAPLVGGTPTTLVTGLYNPGGVAVDSANVYWVATGSPMGALTSIPIGGGMVTTLGTAGVDGTVLVAGPNVYWGGDSVLMTPKTGGSTVVLWSGGQVGSLATDGTYVYWPNDSGSINRAPLGGGTVETLASGPSIQNAFGIAVDDRAVYWTNYGGLQSGIVWRIAKP